MGKLATTGVEQATTVVTGTLGSATAGTSTPMFGPFNLALWGTFSATAQLQRSFDGGTTWIAASTDATGTAANYTAAASVTVTEPEHGVLYRVSCTAYTSGTINYRLSGSTDLYATGRGFQ